MHRYRMGRQGNTIIILLLLHHHYHQLDISLSLSLSPFYLHVMHAKCSVVDQHRQCDLI